MTEVSYVDGNVNSPVLVHGEDPTNTDNVLVTRLGTSESVPKESVSTKNDDPDGTVDEAAVRDEAKNAADAAAEKDAEIADLKEQLAANAAKEKDNA